MNDTPRLTDGSAHGDLGRHFTDLAHHLVRGDDVLDADLVVDMVLRAVPTAESCGLTLVRPDRPVTTVASTSEEPVVVDRLQLDSGEGPLMDTAPGRGVVVVRDLLEDVRWPRFAKECARSTGIRSLLTLRLVLAGGDHAVLSVFARDPASLGETDVTTLSMMAPFAALAVESKLRLQDVGNLTAALETSRQIGIAVGIVMASHRVTSDEGFALLRRASMDLNRKLHDVAQEVELTGTVPQPDGTAASGGARVEDGNTG